MMVDRASGPRKDPVDESSRGDSGPLDLDLAGAIHDVNQMLAVVTGRAGLLLHRGPGADWERSLRAMELAARDAGAILARLGGDIANPLGDEGSGGPLRQAVADAGLLINPPGGGTWTEDAGGNWNLENEVPVRLAADLPIQVVREVLNNLLLNSLEVAPEGVRVRISGSIREDRAVLVYRDNGPGLSEPALMSLFQPGHSASGQPGRGIGLARCRELLRRWQGDLRLADDQDSGAAFELDLPLADPVEPEKKSATGSAVRSARSVLIVDDEPAVRDMLAEVMGELGCTVVQARDSGEALAAFSQEAFDLVILDQSLPGMQGDELAGLLREKDPVVAIVLATGWGREKALADVDPGHVDLTAVKPLAMSKMVDLLSEGSALADRRRAALQLDGNGDSISERDREC